ncbi:MAG: WYL domain-containing protein [Spirochaetia bacterium]
MERGKFKPKFNRIVFIDRKIREGTFPNARILAEEYEGVSARTIKRDIEWLRDFHDAPIEYSYRKKGYYYSEEDFALPALRISESEMFSMAIAEQALSQYRNTPVYERLRHVFDKITDLLPERVTVAADWLHSRFTIFEEPFAMINEDVWKSAMEGLRDERSIRFHYTAPGYSNSVVRTLNPYHAVCHKGQWYLIGYEGVKEEVRIFAFSRMSDVYLLDRRFNIPEDFSLDDFVDRDFGVFARYTSYSVRLRIASDVHTFFTERIWHRNQKLETGPDGTLILSFPTNQLEEVMYWVLSWGEHVVVEEPKELVDMVRGRLEKTLEQYM